MLPTARLPPLLPRACVDHGLSHVARCFGVVLELHGVGGTALRLRAQGGGVAEHFGQGHFGLDGLAAAGHVVHALHRSEEHTSELQSHSDLVCRLLLEKKKKEQLHKASASRTATADPSDAL